MTSTETAKHKAICYRSYWRGLRDSDEGHPRHYVMLSSEEIADLVATGSFSLPLSVIPESVRAYRAAQEGVDEAIELAVQSAEAVTPDPALVGAIDEALADV